ncbi:MAG: hypothetical protein K0R38_3198 [Polyangiaceae bacterium]|jgi:hypothetical protein|nr:hypothetical protein [Polyangiaceae bacterium]
MTLSIPDSLVSFVIPSSERTDPEPVKSSLLLARSDFERGELREALRHLRRAAEGADQAGSEHRAVALARAAADLATEVGGSASPPPVETTSAPSTVFPVSAVRSATDPASIEHLLASGQAIEVSIKRSTRDDGLYVVRRAHGEGPPLGSRRAVVVLLEADDGFFEAP